MTTRFEITIRDKENGTMEIIDADWFQLSNGTKDALNYSTKFNGSTEKWRVFLMAIDILSHLQGQVSGENTNVVDDVLAWAIKVVPLVIKARDDDLAATDKPLE